MRHFGQTVSVFCSMSSDDEKWANIVGNDNDDEKPNVNNIQMPNICLKKIPADELILHRPIKAPKRRKKSRYFVSDVSTTLSVEDIQYQLINTSDTINLKQIPEILKKNGKSL